MAKLDNGAWVLVADGEKALFLCNVTDAENPNLEVLRRDMQSNPKNVEQATDRPGRKQDDAVRQMSAMEETDWHRLAKDRFADDLAEMLYRDAHRGAFDKLVIVAPPQTLAELRAKMHKEVTSRIVAEIDKDFTNHPVDRIEELVKKNLAG